MPQPLEPAAIVRERIGPYLVVACLVTVVYCVTMAPSLTWSHWGSDGGDFITAATTGRVPHPPGFPTYLFLSRASLWLQPSDPARALNYLSALCALGAVLLTVGTVRSRGVSPGASVTAGCSLAFSPWFWSQALITEVYATAALFASLTIFLVQRVEARRLFPWTLVGLGLGLGVSTHLTLIFLMPYVVLGRKVHWPGLMAGLAVGILPYALLPLFGPWPQPWGDLSTIAGWVEYVSARMYWGNAWTLPSGDWPARTLAWATLVTRQFTPLGALLIITGAAWRWSGFRMRVLGGAVAFLMASLYAIGYNSPDSWVYLVPHMALAAVALGDGLQALAVSEGRIGILSRALGLSIPILLLALYWQDTSLSNDHEAVDWLSAALTASPTDAVIVTNQDHHTFALWYATEAVVRRPDLMVVDERLWGYGPYDAFVRQALGGQGDTIGALAATRTLCYVDIRHEVVCQ